MQKIVNKIECTKFDLNGLQLRIFENIGLFMELCLYFIFIKANFYLPMSKGLILWVSILIQLLKKKKKKLKKQV